MHPTAPRLLKFALLLIATYLIVACGGGGSDDTEPDSFNFTNQSDVALSTEITSNSITVNDISKAVSISISGSGEYSVNGGTFRSSSSEVEEGDTVRVQVTSSAEFSTETSATLTIGGVSDTFTVTTLAEDATPDDFTVNAVEGAEPGSTVASDAITVSGINVPVAISVSGGMYSVNGGDYVDTEGTVSDGDTVTVQVTAASELETDVTASLDIGGVTGDFVVTTSGDIYPPEAMVYFPTPNVLTEGTSLSIRGAAYDEFSSIGSINVVVSPDGGTTESQNLTLTPEGDDDFSQSWSTDITLTEDVVNTVSVYATDSEGNRQQEPTVVNITQSSTVENFPEGSASIGDDTFGVVNMSFSPDGNELWVPVANASESALMGVNLETGVRSEIYSKTELQNAGSSCNGVSYYEPLDTVVMACEADVLRVNRADGSVTGLPELTTSSTAVRVSTLAAEYYDEQTMWIADVVTIGSDQGTLFYAVSFADNSKDEMSPAILSPGTSLEPVTNEILFIISEGGVNKNEIENTAGDWSTLSADTALLSDGAAELVSGLLQEGVTRAIAVTDNQSVYEIDFDAAGQDDFLVSSNAMLGLEANPLFSPVGVVNNSEKRLSFVVDSSASVPFSIILVDLESGHRVVQSRSVASEPL